MKVDGVMREYWRITAMLQNQLSQWCRETGDHPRGLTVEKELFDRLCAETADVVMKKDESLLSMIESFKIAGPNGYVIITRATK